MDQINPRRSRRPLLARLAIFAVAATLVASACTGAASSPSAPTTSAAPATEAPGSAAPASGSPAAAPAAPANPYVETGAVPGSGAGKKIGYISLGEHVPSSMLVSNGIKEQAEIAGRGPRVLRLQARYRRGSRLCPAVGRAGRPGRPQLPGVSGSLARDLRGLRQRPDDRHRHRPAALRGRLHGRQQPRGRTARRCRPSGKYAKDNWDCDYTAYVSLESTGAGDANDGPHGRLCATASRSTARSSTRRSILTTTAPTRPSSDDV